MKKMLSAAAAAALSLTASSALAAPLVNPTVTLSNNGLSQPTAITATYTTATALAANEFILKAQMPAGFTKATSQIDDCTGVTLKVNGVVQSGAGALNCTLTTSGIVWIWTRVPVAGGAVTEVNLDASLYRTPSTPGVKTFPSFETAQVSGATIDGAAPPPSVTIVAPAPVPTMTEWAMILLTLALGGFAALTIQKRRRTV